MLKIGLHSCVNQLERSHTEVNKGLNENAIDRRFTCRSKNLGDLLAQEGTHYLDHGLMTNATTPLTMNGDHLPLGRC